MKPTFTQMGKQRIARIASCVLLLLAGTFSSHSAQAHIVIYYSPPCITAGQQVILPVKVTYCNSSTWYRWQYRTNNGAPGAWTFLNNGSNTINGTAFTVTNASLKTNVADSCASLRINNATTALNNVEFRVLMGDNADPQVVTSPVWGGDNQALHEAKMVRLSVRPSTESCFSGCTDNMLVVNPPALMNTPLTDFYGGFEAGSNNFGGTHANGSSLRAQTDLTQWTGGSLGNSPRYRVANNPDTLNTAFGAFAPHSGRQQMLVSRSANSNTRVWFKTIVANASPTQSYYFTSGSMMAWVAKADGGANPTLVLEIVGTNNANANVVLASTSFAFTTQAVGQWVQVSVAEVNIPSNTYKRIEYRIRNTNTTANSFALDDICLRTPTAGPLPVSLTALKGQYANGTASLTWATQLESNSSHFIVERSNDGSTFSSVGQVAAAGFSNVERAYRFNDIKVNNGVQYYRLKAVDKDGSYSYSNTVAVQVAIKGMSITGIYPSPFTDKVNVALSAENSTTATLRLLDNIGRPLRQQTNAVNKGPNNLVLLNLDGLAKGIYLLEIHAEGKVHSQKIIKQ